MGDRRVIRGATVVALDGRRVLRKTDLLIEDGIIAAMGGVDTAGAMITEVHGVVMPGLVQAHVHLDEVLLDRHFVADPDPHVFARQRARWRAGLDEHAVEVQAASGVTRGLASGTLTFADAGRRAHRKIALEAAAALGVRLVACLDATAGDVARDLDVLDAELDDDAAKSRLRFGIWAGDAERTPSARLELAAKRAVERGLPLFVSAGSEPGDRDAVRRLDRARALSKHLVVAGGAARSLGGRSGIAELARSGASVVLTPAADLLAGAPIAPIEELVAARVNLGLGSKTGATRLGLDLFEELKLLYRLLSGRVPEPASNALEIAVRGGAQAVGFGAQAVAVGQPADLLLLDVEAGPTDDHELVARRIIVQGEPAIIRAAWVAGQVVLSDGRTTRGERPTEADEDALRRRLHALVETNGERRGLFARVSAELRERQRLAEGWHAGALPILPEARTTSLAPTPSRPESRARSVVSTPRGGSRT